MPLSKIQGQTYTIDYLVVAGGGGGGGQQETPGGGGGGAGGFISKPGVTVVKKTDMTVTVGAGGAGGSGLNHGSAG